MICILHVVPTTQSEVSFHQHILASFSLYYSHPFPSGHHCTTPVCVYEFQYTFFNASGKLNGSSERKKGRQ